MVFAKGATHHGRMHRDVHGEPVDTKSRLCLRCRRTFESEGAHHRLCNGCGNAT